MCLLLQMMELRRELGILMGYLALVHGLTFLAPAWGTDSSLLPPYFWLGIMALFLTMQLLLTANNPSLRLLGGIKWKLLHRLVYLLFVAAVFHESLRPGEGTSFVSDRRALGGIHQGDKHCSLVCATQAFNAEKFSLAS